MHRPQPKKRLAIWPITLKKVLTRLATLLPTRWKLLKRPPATRLKLSKKRPAKQLKQSKKRLAMQPTLPRRRSTKLLTLSKRQPTNNRPPTSSPVLHGSAIPDRGAFFLLEPTMPPIWKLPKRSITFESTPVVMGILNATPDSFSDGGRLADCTAAVDAALAMEDAGAGIIDIGGESTRPYAPAVDADEELRRVVPVIQQLQGRLSCPISIDTSKAVVAQAAIDAGAEIINDVSGLQGDPQMFDVGARNAEAVCAMHMQGTPQTMQDDPRYDNVVHEIYQYLADRKQQCLDHGIEAQRICLDPGIGFGKTHEHNIELLRGVSEFLKLGVPILIGHSRKGFIGKQTGDDLILRDAGTVGVSLAMAAAGMHILRVHNVPMTVAALKLFQQCQPR